MKTVALILARAGSKRILGKNTINFCGKPLLLWTIEQLKEVKEIDSIWLSSDNPVFLKMGMAAGCKPILRPIELSGSEASSESGWEHGVRFIEKKITDVDVIIAPQVTSPVREPKDMSKALQEFERNKYNFMCSSNAKGFQNGSFYIFRVSTFKNLKNKKFAYFNQKITKRFIMEYWKNYEIDYLIDLKTCEVLMRHFILNDKYYETRDMNLSNSFYEENYWINSADPDGVLRNTKDELKKKLEDCKEELAYINSLPPGNILDIGCGLGYMISGVNSSWRKYGIDVSEWAVERARKYCTSFKGTLEEANYRAADLFDAIILYQSLEHIPDPIELLIKIRFILKPGGKLILNTPNFGCDVAKRFGDNFRFLHDKGHVSLFDSLGLVRLLSDLDFRVEKVTYPYFNTVHFTEKNLMRLFDTSKVSPPSYGNLMTVYSHKKKMILEGK